jgi:predicted phage terminase large subunit-like protein
MARSISRFDRFVPKSDVKWLTHEQRASHRKTIGVLQTILNKLERREQLTEPEEALVFQLCQSHSFDTRVNAAVEMLDKTEENYYGMLARMGPHDLTAYHEFMNPHEPPAPHHAWLCDHLMKVESGEIQLLAVAMPPGSAKSTYASRSFAQWYMGRNPDKRVLATGHSQKFAEDEFSKPNRNAMNTEEYRKVFEDVFVSQTEKSASFWRLSGGWRGLYTVRGALAGVSGVRANLLLGDDFYKHAQDALSQVVNDSIWRWFSTDLMSRRLPAAPIVLVNTRWTSHDVVGQLEQKNKDEPQSIPQPAVFLNISAQAGDNDILGREEGEWLWEDFYGAQHYETLRATMPPGLWSALYLGKPMDQQGDFVSEEDFQRFETIPVNKEGEKIQYTRCIMSVDTSQKSNERSDYCAIGIFRKRIDGVHCLVDVWRGKKPLEQIIRIMKRLMEAWGVHACIIEDAGMGSQILENYAGKLPAALIPYLPGPRSSKDFRFDAAAPWITAGKIQFPKQAPWLTDFINELVAYPNGENDDQVDMLSQYCDNQVKIRSGGVKKLRMGG